MKDNTIDAIIEKATEDMMKKIGDIIESDTFLFGNTKKNVKANMRLCDMCYFSGRLILHQTLKSECEICGKTIHNNCLALNRYCDDCSDKYHICVLCGAKLNMEKS